MMFKAALILAATAMTAAAHAETVFFDFGSLDNQTTITGWNNVTYPTGSDAPDLTSIVDSTGTIITGMGLSVTDQFFNADQPFQGGTNSPAGDAAGLASTATKDFFLGHTGTVEGNPSTPTAAFKLTGLSAGQTYDFSFFAARIGVSDNRETAYTVTGANTAYGVLDAADNKTEILTLAGITPDANNEILVSLAAGPNNTNSQSFYYINAMQLDIVPEPTSLALLGLGSLLLTRRNRRRND